ncbi:MAG: hypothetical protein DKM24_01790 [Candidatus Melainabacteria bacterium]|nr:MAG: hypothetical protein DKM24_01790 [Candidatus Melainabacteria bacterium]
MKFKFKNLIAFTLSEMMIVLLIVSVISAATIPTITQQKQKPYNVTENNSTSTNDIWKYDKFSGITVSDSLSDSDQKVVIGTDTKSYTASQIDDYKTAFDGTRPALVIQKNQGTLAKNADRGQMILYDRGKYVGSVGLDASDNIMIGANALTHSTDVGSKNIAVGYYAGNGNLIGAISSIMIGEKAMSSNIPIITRAIAIGRYAAYGSSYELESVNIGECAGSNVCYGPVKYANAAPTYNGVQQKYNIAIGSMAGRLGYRPLSAFAAINNISIGYYSGNYGYGAAGNNGRDMQMENISIGTYSGLNNAYSNTVNIGVFAGGRSSNNKNDYHEIKESNINIGHYAGANNDSDSLTYNSALISSEGQNVKIGNYAGVNNFGLSRSVTIGSFAGFGARGSYFKNGGTLGASTVTAIGYYAMYGASSSNAVAIGAYAGAFSASSDAIMIGKKAGYNNSGVNNILIGQYAAAETSLSNSIAIGFEAGKLSGGSNNVFIGYGAGHFGSSRVTGSNKYILLPYSSSTFQSDTGYRFNLSSTRPQMIIGPGHGAPGGASFNNTILLLYANKVYARQTSMTLFSSDRRAKENIIKAKYGINEIRKINTYTFNFKSDKTKNVQVGLIAQEVQKYIPEAVKENIYTGKLMIDFDWILFPVANAIKDVDKTLTQMNKDLIAQAKQLVSLEKHVDKLESKVRTTFEKQEKMQYKLNDTKDILNKMENK